MTPTYNAGWRGCEAKITTRNYDLNTKVVASVEMLNGPDKGLSTTVGLRDNLHTEAEILALLAASEDLIEVGAQTSEYPIINIS